MVMTRFDEYLKESQDRMNLNPIPLIRDWKFNEINDVINDFENALDNSDIISSQIPNLSGTNQSKGNQVEKYFVSKLINEWSSGDGIFDAPGKGYPDRILIIRNQKYLMEIKATSNWNERDSIRRVLTASPQKMRDLVNRNIVGNPPAHLIITVIYSRNQSTIGSIRMDFINSTTEIDVRFEASTSQKRLTNGDHETKIFG